MKEILKFIWQLPQNVIGLIVIKATNAKKRAKFFDDKIIPYYVASRLKKHWWGVSLGKYIIISDDMYTSEYTIRHEYGHQRQSLYLGWLYLILIGLPSAIGNIVTRNFTINYYRLPWEWWANKLGGLN